MTEILYVLLLLRSVGGGFDWRCDAVGQPLPASGLA
jgi:hypothetical protein